MSYYRLFLSLALGFLVGALLLSAGVHADSFYGSPGTATYVQSGIQSYYTSDQIHTYWPILDDKQSCEGRQDILLQVAPVGCQPAVVRSDLLAEQNVPVFCQIDALKVNPVIDIKQIRSLTFGGKYPASVVGVGFHPARAALQTQNGLLGSPLLNNIGYIVVVLKKTPKESDVPSEIKLDLSATIDYTAGNSLGIGRSEFLLKEVDDRSWEVEKNRQSFFNGKFSVRLESADAQRASVSIYEGDRKLTTASVDKGKQSSDIYLPGSYCQAALKVAYDGFQGADSIARVQVDDDLLDLYQGSRFLNDRCSVSKIVRSVSGDEVSVSCSGARAFVLKLSSVQFFAGDRVRLLGSEDVWTISKVDEKAHAYTLHKEGMDVSGDRVADFADVRSLAGEMVAVDKISTDVNLESYFNQTIEHYEQIVRDYPLEKDKQDLDGQTEIGNLALQKAIALAKDSSKFATAARMMNLYIQVYPQDAKAATYAADLSDLYRYDYSNAVNSVFVDNGAHTIRLVELREPAKKSKASFAVGNGLSQEVNLLGKLSEEGVLNFTLDSLSANQAGITVYCSNSRTSSGTHLTLTLNDQVNSAKSACDTIIKLTSIDLEEFAKVRLLPSSHGPETKTNLSVVIGVEKRAIKLTPDKAIERIENLNKSIAKWESISSNLGNVAKTMQAACFATAGVLTVKNFVSGLDGEALARQKVMQGPDGWTEWCKSRVKASDGGKSYSTIGECFSDNSGKIDTDVSNAKDIISAENDKIKNVEKGLTTKDNFLGTSVDANAATKKYVATAFSGSEEIKLNDGSTVKTSQLTKDLGDRSAMSYQEAKDLKFYLDLKAKSKPDSVSYKAAEKNLAAIGGNVNDRIKSQETQVSISSALKNGNTGLGTSVRSYGTEKSLVGYYEGGTIGGIDGVAKEDVNKPGEVLVVDGKPYLAVLENTQGNNYRAVKYYPLKTAGGLAVEGVPVDKIADAPFRNFQKVDRKSCVNAYKNPEVRYFESEPYKGMPALVPIDTEEGWYAATRQTIPAFGNIGAFQSSGRPVSFWVCNVGSDGEADFLVSGFDDDICQQFNMETGQSLTSFACLDEASTKQIVNRAVNDLNDAARQYKSGVQFVQIEGRTIKVGSPATNIPGTQCQDFMSPDDCKLLFNVCDPVICPASRCDFGGLYPVADVVQSGIVGSALLCLPNYREGVVLPVCLTGIKAGIDGYLSILKSSRQCLQESVDSGKSVGICDAITSVYTCEFFWRQAAPVANVLLPKVVEFAYNGGRNTPRGGGEYLTVKSSWDNAQASVNYFTQNYASNSLKAFNIRSIEEAGSSVCRAFVSAKGPKSFESLIEPQSPAQFHAWFSEIPFTDATVPATSQYKVFYHVFSGNDHGVSFSVYLKEPTGSSYYQTPETIVVDSGFVQAGQFKTETKDFTAPQGYKQLCVRIDGNEECGFKQVSSSFAVNNIKDEFVSGQIDQEAIKSESECVSGSVNPSALLNVNPEEAAQEAIDPAIYNRGVVRICATRNPGESTDPTRFVNVGYCDDQSIGCWLDSQSVENAITQENLKLKNDTYSALRAKSIADLTTQGGGYLDEFKANNELGAIDASSASITDFESARPLLAKLEVLNDEVILNYQKANVLYKIGQIYEKLTRNLLPQIEKAPKDVTTNTQAPESEIIAEEITKTEQKCSISFFNGDKVVTDRTSFEGEKLGVQVENCRPESNYRLKLTFVYSSNNPSVNRVVPLVAFKDGMYEIVFNKDPFELAVGTFIAEVVDNDAKVISHSSFEMVAENGNTAPNVIIVKK